MIFLANPQVWHLPRTWAENPIDGPLLGMTLFQMTLLLTSIAIPIFISLFLYATQLKKLNKKRASSS